MAKTSDIIEPEKMMSIKELTSVLQCSKNFAYQLVGQQDFPKIRVNSRIFIPVSKFNEWVANYLYKDYDITTK